MALGTTEYCDGATAAPAITYSPLQLTGANAASGTVNFNTPALPLDVTFTSIATGTTANNQNLSVAFTSLDMGAIAPPKITVTGSTINVVLNSNATGFTTAQSLITAINTTAASKALVTASFTSGNPATNIATSAVHFPNSVNLAGADDTVITPGYLALGDTPQQVVMRFAQTLAGGLYRLEVFGTDNSAQGTVGLRDANGALFSPSVPNTNRDTVDFSLDPGPQITSVVPQPLSRNVSGALVQNQNQVVVYFNSDPLNPDVRPRIPHSIS